MTQEELELKFKEILKKIDSKDKKQFLKDLKSINHETDKLDKAMKNIIDGISLFFTINIDKKITKLIYDIAENIENPKLNETTKSLINALIEKFLGKSEQKNDSGTNPSEEVKELWKETKKVRKAL